MVVAGPTGTGKSDLALELAHRLDGAVVNADSMQLYRGMDIGTAKLAPAARRGVAHHLLDVLDVTQTANVADYQRDARAVIEQIIGSGRTPILVGGSGLYIQAVIDDIDFPGTDPAVRSRLEAELADRGIEPLRARLAGLDPAAALAIQARDARRVIRALEVVEVTGQPFTATLPRPGAPRYEAVLLNLERDTLELDTSLELRVQTMVRDGFLEEVRVLAEHGLRTGQTARRALGYRQMLAVLDGQLGLEVAIAETVRTTRRFVRRQRSWFGRDTRFARLDAADPDLVAVATALAVSARDR